MSSTRHVAIERALLLSHAVCFALVIVGGIVAALLRSWPVVVGTYSVWFAALGVVHIVKGLLLAKGQLEPGPLVGHSAFGQVSSGCARFLISVLFASMLGQGQSGIGLSSPGPAALCWALFPLLVVSFVLEWRAKQRYRREAWCGGRGPQV
jgi:hypothetical protein